MAQRIRETTDHFLDDVKRVTERWWDTTQRVAGTAGARASGVRRRTQSKLDLAAVRRKVEARCGELGRGVYAAHLEHDPNPLAREEVVRLFRELDVLHQREETLTLNLATTADRGTWGTKAEDEDEEELHP